MEPKYYKNQAKNGENGISFFRERWSTKILKPPEVYFITKITQKFGYLKNGGTMFYLNFEKKL